MFSSINNINNNNNNSRCTSTDDHTLIKYYLDKEIKRYIEKFEREDITRFTSDSFTDNHASIVTSLLSLFDTLRQASLLFRLKMLKIGCHNRGQIVSMPRMMDIFFSNHFYKSSKEFNAKCPCLYQMIRAVTCNINK